MNSEINIHSLAAELSKHIPIVAGWPRWMSLKMAAEYSQYGQKKLIELAASKKIRGFQDSELKTGPWIFDKESIDAYRMEQAAMADDSDESKNRRKRAVAILDSVRLK